MIIVLVRYKCKSGCREKYFDAISAHDIGKLSRSENGNIQYEYSFGIKDDELLLTEIWKNEESIEAHRNSDHFKILGDLKTEYVEGTEILRYKAEQV